MFSGGIAFSRYAYNKIVGYDVTWEPGGDALPKGFTTMPYRGANNIGVQGKELSGRLWDDMWLEGDLFRERLTIFSESMLSLVCMTFFR